MKNVILRMSLLTAVVAFSVTAFSTPASAQFYAGGKGSAFLPNKSEEGLKNFDTGFGGEAFAGYRFIPFFGLEGGIGYYQSKLNESNVDGSGIDSEVKISALPLTFTAKGFLPLGAQARLYAGAGVGIYFAKAKVGASGEFEDVTVSASVSDKATAFGYHAVLGGEFMVAPMVGLQGEVKLFETKPKFSFGDEADSNDKFKIGGVMISFGVLFQM